MVDGMESCELLCRMSKSFSPLLSKLPHTRRPPKLGFI